MISMLTALLRSAVKRQLRDFLLDAAVIASIALLFVVSIGFATFAGFSQLRSVEGPIAAAAIVAAAYASVAIAIAVFWGFRRRAGQLRARATASTQPPSGNDDPSMRLSSAFGIPSENVILTEAMKLGSELSTVQLLVLALVGGLVAGRNIRK